MSNDNKMLREYVKEVISEKSDLISTQSGLYFLIYDTSELLNNILLGMRVIKGVATVYQRDSIKRSGSRARVPIELSYTVPTNYGGADQYLRDLEKATRGLKGVISLIRNPQAGDKNRWGRGKSFK